MKPISSWHADTPFTQDKLFFNSAGASLVPEAVTNTIISYLQREAEVGGYKLAEKEAKANHQFYHSAARLLNCTDKNIAFAHDATDAYAKALSSIPFQSGDVIITTDDDYASNHIQFISLSRRFDIRIKRIRNHEDGTLDLDHFTELVNAFNPKLVAVTHIPTNSGLIQDIEPIGQICQDNKILYLVDACQSVGQMPVDVQQIKCDFLTATGRKFLRGPRGTGFLYVSDAALQSGLHPLFPDMKGADWIAENEFILQPDAKRFQYWEAPYALMRGLQVAIDLAIDNDLEAIRKYNNFLSESLREKLSKIPEIQILDHGTEKASIVTWYRHNSALSELKDWLDQHRIYYSVAVPTSALLDFQKKQVPWAIRFSPHYFNTIQEVDQLSDIISLFKA